MIELFAAADGQITEEGDPAPTDGLIEKQKRHPQPELR